MMQSNDTKNIMPWIMWLLAASFYCYEFFLQVSPGVMAKELTHDLAINATSLGVLAAMYFYAYAALQIPVGLLLDKYQAKRILVIFLLLCVSGAILFGATSKFAIAIIGRFMIGAGSSAAILGTLYIAAHRLPKDRFSFLVGITITAGTLGAIIGQAPLAIVVDKIGWHATMLSLGLIGMIICGLIAIIVKDLPASRENPASEPKIKTLTGLKQVLSSKQTWLCAIYAGIMYTPVIAFGTLWGVQFITLKCVTTKPFAALLISLTYIGLAIGSPTLGWLSDYFRKRVIFMLITNIMLLVSVLLAIYMPITSMFVNGLFLFCLGFSAGGLVLGFSAAREINHSSIVGTAVGFMNTINMLGGALTPPIIGFTLDITNNYAIALSILPILSVISLILMCSFKMKPLNHYG